MKSPGPPGVSLASMIKRLGGGHYKEGYSKESQRSSMGRKSSTKCIVGNQSAGKLVTRSKTKLRKVAEALR